MAMERFLLEFIESRLAEFVKEEMKAEYVQFAEAKCNYAATITYLQDNLSKCHCTIESLSLQIKQISIPFGSETMLSSDEKVVLLTELPNFEILKAVYNHVVVTMPIEGTGFFMKLRLNCPGPFLPSLFYVSTTSVSQIVLK